MILVIARRHKDVAGWVEDCGDSPGKEYVAFEASNSVGLPAKKKKRKPTLKAANWECGTNVSDPLTMACILPLLVTRPELCLFVAIADFPVAPE